MGYIGSIVGKGLAALAFGTLLPAVEGVAATPEHPVQPVRPRLALVSLVAPELLSGSFVQDIDVREPVLSRGDPDLAEYVEWHRWPSGSLLVPSGADGKAEAPRHN